MLLGDDPQCEVVGYSASSVLLSDLALELSESEPDVVVWDLGWETAVADLPDFQELGVPAVALLAEGEPAGDVWAAGPRAILPRDMDADRLLAAAQAVYQGLFVIDPTLADGLLPAVAFDEDDPITAALTPREAEVLQLLAEGLTNKAIAQVLGISDHTIKFHVNAILGKLGAQSRTEAVVRATRLGLLSL